MAFNFRHLLQRARFNVRAVPARIVKQMHQLATLFQVKPHQPLS
ncbi:hypothetical protein BN130_4227 [Cronobacter malonaticus 507]|nr:hypothetical protein BN130_4227 [Cronobacter malonaticus 507]